MQSAFLRDHLPWTEALMLTCRAAVILSRLACRGKFHWYMLSELRTPIVCVNKNNSTGLTPIRGNARCCEKHREHTLHRRWRPPVQDHHLSAARSVTQLENHSLQSASQDAKRCPSASPQPDATIALMINRCWYRRPGLLRSPRCSICRASGQFLRLVRRLQRRIP